MKVASRHKTASMNCDFNEIEKHNHKMTSNTITDSFNYTRNTNKNWPSSYNAHQSPVKAKSQSESFISKHNDSNSKNKTNYFNKQKYSSPSDIYYPNNYKKSNAKILSKILDSKRKFAPNSPSNKQIIEKEIQSFDAPDITNDNKHNYLLSSLALFLRFVDKEFEKYQNIEDKLNIIIDVMSSDINWNIGQDSDDQLEYQEKEKMIQLGGLVALYLSIKKYQDQIERSTKENVIKCLLNLLSCYDSYEELFLAFCLDICSLLSPSSLLTERIDLISMFITDFNYPKLQKSSFDCLMSLKEEGIKMLIELSLKDYQDYQAYILQNLIETPHIQKMIIVRALINDVFSNNHEKRLSALSALSRMKDLVNEPQLLSKLYSCFNDQRIRKGFIASILRTSGEIGEKMLIDQLERSKDLGVKVAIINSLSYRLRKQETYLQMRLDNNDTSSISKKLPGMFCNYHGSISPYIDDNYNTNNSHYQKIFNRDDKDSNISFSFTDYQENRKNYPNDNGGTDEYLEVSTRDFLSSLERMLSINFENSIKTINYLSYTTSELNSINVQYSSNDYIIKYSELFYSEKSISNNNDYSYFYQINSSKDISQDYFPISNNVIRALIKCLKDSLPKIREEAVVALGMIGLPEGINAIEFLYKTLKDTELNVKAKVLWSIGKLCPCAEVSNMIPSIAQCMNNNMWKVKLASFYCIGKIGDQCSDIAIPILIKQLKESPINKNLIAETMSLLGEKGENALLKLITNESDTNFKLKSAIARALGFVDIYSNNFDFIIECLFRQSDNFSPQVRYSAMFSINGLAIKANEKINYLRKKNIIPYYYDKLKDKDPFIQQYATNCLGALGAQGELIFIEGLIKDPNPIVRQNCGIGLSEMGVHTLRTMIIGLHDEDENVRKGIEKVITTKMPKDSVLAYFLKERQILSLKVSIQDLFDKNISLCRNTSNYFNSLMCRIAKLTQGSSRNISQ